MSPRKVPVQVTYRKSGTRPPVYIAGDFSDATWIPQEMEYTTDSTGEYTFLKEVVGYEGSRVQYKIRIGTDWWVLNEEASTVDDGSGNLNNVIEIPSLKGSSNETPTAETAGGEVNGKKPMLGDGAKPSDQPKLQDKPKKIVANAAKELLSRNESRSGASTPTFAKTAAEVADSAALLDKEESEPEVPDEEAGRLGLRRLSSTPITEVAKTAAEVADTARDLDAEETIDPQSPPPDHRDMGEFHAGQDFVGEQNDHGEHKPPLFSHECIGMYEPDGDAEDDSIEEEYDQQTFPSKSSRTDQEDYNDPTLERFPSSRDDIMDTVRKLETGLNEDQASIEGVPPSPVVGMSRRNTNELVDFSSSQTNPPPTVPKPVQRLGIPAPRSPHGSVSSASLQSISEAEDEDHQSPIILLRTPTEEQQKILKYPVSDEDEGVALRDKSARTPTQHDATDLLTPESTTFSKPAEITHETRHDASDTTPGAQGETQDGNDVGNETSPPGTHTIVAENVKKDSPRIVVQPAEENVTVPGSSQQVLPDSELDTQARSESTSHLRKRVSTREPAETTSSAPAPSSQGHKNEGWLNAFFRILFVNWIGGWFSKICGSRRKTLLTAGTAMVFVGIAGWKLVAKDRW